MKKLSIIIFFLASINIYGQGTIHLSNILSGQILFDGIPVTSGEATVQIATMDCQLVGKQIEILDDGYFSGGAFPLQGLTGTVTLRLAVFYTALPGRTVYSHPFEITLGGQRHTNDFGHLLPPTPSPSLFSSIFFGVNYVPSDTSEHTREFLLLDQGKAQYFRGNDLKVIKSDTRSIIVQYNGILEVSCNPDGPWALMP